MSWYTKLPTLKVSSPSHFFKSPELINSSGDHIYKKVVMNQVRHPFKLLFQKFGRLRSQIHCKVPQATVRQQPCKALSHGICHLSILFACTCTGVCKPLQKIQLSFVVFHGTSRLLKSIALLEFLMKDYKATIHVHVL